MGMFLIFIAYGVRAEFDGLYQLRAFNVSNHKLLSTVAQSGERIIVTDMSFVPTLLPQIYYEDRLIYFINDGAHMDAFIAMLQANNIHSFYYVNGNQKQIWDESVGIKLLLPQDKPLRLPHNLWGQVYHVP